MINRPLIGISAGDPAGIGPEVTVKALANKEIFELCRPLVICDMTIVKDIINICNLNLKVNKVTTAAEGLYTFGTVDVLDLQNIDHHKFNFNQIDAMCGKASYEYVEKVIQMALSGEVDGTVTGPIHKEALKSAGYNFAGHTEIFATLTSTKDYAMMLVENNFRVVHVSTHVSLLQAISRVKKERIVKVIQLANEALTDSGILNPRIAVAGLNPHAGENGMFGDEEILEIMPAIDIARQLGINADGPHPPDTIFPKLRGEIYDIVVCMYHDQGHIPTKLLGFKYNPLLSRWESLSGVNITLGLPIIRVSVDHGTAFDKGGKGEANEDSMIQAIKQCTIFSNRKKETHAN